MTKNDLAWELLDKKYRILEEIDRESYVFLKADQLNEFREARLMSKFDTKSQLPEIFRENDLSILPNSRGGYVVGKFNTFKEFNKKNKTRVLTFQIPQHIETIDPNDITSESIALNAAHISGILEDFLEDEQLELTVNGRMSSKSFDFEIESPAGPKIKIDVKKAQIEIDGGYEALNCFALVEAKNTISDDFQIRQVYYPFRLFKEIINKQIRNIFLTYSDGIFHLREYIFQDDLNPNSISLLREKKYDIVNFSLDLIEISNILKKTITGKEPKVPFPQADNFARIVDFCEFLSREDSIKKNEISEIYNFDNRQTSYYVSACKYLGLVDEGRDEENDIEVTLTDLGAKAFSESIQVRKHILITQILKHEVFRQVLGSYLGKSERPDRKEVIKIMKKSNLHEVKSESTFKRRSSTVLSWTDWIIEQSDI